MRLRRTMLFTPGNRPERFSKAIASGADMICLDLEDSVPDQSKADARRHVIDFLSAPRAQNMEIVVRINNLRCQAGLEDLLTLAGAKHQPDLIAVSKTESDAELAIVRSLLCFNERTPGLGLLPLIESLRGLELAMPIAKSAGVVMLVLGTADLAAEMHTSMDWEPMLLARLQLIQAARAAGVGAMDGAWVRVDDQLGLEAETRRAMQIGFDAKPCLHPKQVSTVHAVMLPSAAEIAADQALLAAFDAAGNSAVRHDGRMIDRPLADAARRRLEIWNRASTEWRDQHEPP